ncbi:serine/threonine-protein kinase [Streptomyces sp. GXMU-J15]|uniref:non-specific serine/threonine protein kinase n=1 Tax=Streptomyces fuscus TaxID=3048495 RepID=A0ABT7IYQ8_9ACTN|nr:MULTISPECIES: serine/threonine-protein kinase [Streptomyces]MDL2077733.1 serine/threonine-protein kinase [Streptomyces fuscus]SBT94378.1 Serine/threonine protein kinase [Streptomyces sp. DI166]
MQGQPIAGRYRLVDTIGSGGMGRVWRAHDEVLHRAVAIKELTAAHYVSDSDRDRLLARTRAEARAAARINHSAVVTVHDVLDHDARPWIVMELVEGHSLADAVKEHGRIEPREAARIGMWVLRALRAAHSAGVLHRDVKPGNVLLGDDGRVLLTDFGIAQIEGDTTITRTGEVVGSVDYLAPERIRGHDPGPASDLWALGATLYTAVEGRSPFRRTSPLTTMQAVVEEEAEQPAHAGPLGPVIAALLHKDPAVRPDAAAAEQMLAEAAEGRRPQAAQVYVPTQVSHAPPAPERRTHPHTAPHTPYTPVQPTPYTPPAPPKRRRVRLLALVVVLAALVGGGTVVALQKWDEGRRADGASSSQSPTPTSTPSGTGTPDSTPQSNVPDGWERIEDPLGFSLSLPEGWKRSNPQESGSLQQIDYSPDGGRNLLRIAVDTSPQYDDPYPHMVSLDQQLGDRLVDYDTRVLESTTYRDRQAARLEYTWTQLAKDSSFPGPFQAVDQLYIARDGAEYAFYMAAPVDEFPEAKKRFEAVLRSWREPVS